MTPERIERFKQVIRQRQLNLTVILEDVHDPHNIGAVMRSCESVGICEIYVLYTYTDHERFYLGHNSASSAKKWVTAHFHTDRDACFNAVKNKYDQILATHLDKQTVDLYDLDLSGSVALLFGNERNGVSEASLKYCDGNFAIPQMGMIKSLNVSVACAVTLYEALRQRMAKGHYEKSQLSEAELNAMYEDYVNR